MSTAKRIDALSSDQLGLLLRRLRERGASAPADAPLPLETPIVPAVPFDPHQPSPLGDTQATFWIGGTGLYDLGGSSATVYVEYEASGNAGDLAARLDQALTHTVVRHPILRTVVSADGMQRVLPETPPCEVELVDLSRMNDEEAEHHLESTRERLRYSRHPVDRWPRFDLVVHQLPEERIRLQARFDAMLVDGTSRNRVIEELVRGVLTGEGAKHAPAPEVTYFDFLRALEAFRATATWRRCRAYWQERLLSLPPAPRLPLARDFGPDTVPRAVWRRTTILDPASWATLRRRAAQRKLTPSGIGIALLIEVLRAWSEEPSFTIGLEGSYVPSVHPQIGQVIGMFTTLYLLEAEEASGPFAQRAQRLQNRLNTDLDHQHFSGYEALREWNRARRAGGRATLPIRVTSILRSGSEPGTPVEGTEAHPSGDGGLREIDVRIIVPQVLLLCVVGESADGSLFLISQVVEELFPPGLVPDLIDGYRRLALRLAEDEAAWSEPRPLRPLAAAFAEPERPSPVAGLGPGDRLLSLSPPGSELARSETDAAQAAGAAVVVPAADERAPEALAALAVRERITVWSSPPALFEGALHRMENDRRLVPSTLRRVLLHRDRVPPRLPARLRALGLDAQILFTWGTAGAPIAAAGPMEDTEEAGSHPPLWETAGWRLHVLDRDRMSRPTWVPGDLYLSGGPAAGPLKATGERARRLPDGRIELLGNEPPPPAEALGYGSDPRRVEAALSRHPGIRQAVVAWRENEQRLVAWLLPGSGNAPSDDALRDHLRATFPEHLLPSLFVRRDELPLTFDGSVNRTALTVPAAAPRPTRTALNSRETELAALWEEVVGHRPVTPEDDFFELGGNSLLAARLLSRAADRFELTQPLARFLDRPTLACLAELVDQACLEKERSRQEPAAAGSPLRRLRSRLAAFRSRLLPPATSPAYNMRLFLLLWFSQFVSGIGTGLGSFALGVWVYRQNASATQYSLFAFVATCTGLLVGPLSGVLADRWDRKRLILLGDGGAAVMTCLMALALYTGQMRLWHVYIIVVAMVGFSALQGPAMVATTSQLVSRRQLARVSGMIQAAATATGLICPPLSGALVPVIGYHGVIAIDIATFLFAFLVLLFIRLPGPAAAAPGHQRRSVLGDFRFGWDYLRQRPGLLSLLWIFAAMSFALSIVQVLLTPLILSFGSAANLGFVNSAMAAGGLIGSLALSIWGGPKNRMNGILLLLLLQAPILLLGAAKPNVMLIAMACFLFTALSPIVGGLSQAIWQSKVSHHIQGRVFAMRGLLLSAAAPVAFLLAGPLADRVFEPLMAPRGALAGTIGQIIGTGKGRGVGLLFMTLGLFLILFVVLMSLNPRLRKVESELPDATSE